MIKVAETCVPHVADSRQSPRSSGSRPRHGRDYLHLSLLRKCTHLLQFKQVHAQIIKQAHDQTDTHLAKLVESLVGSAQMDYSRSVLCHMAQPSTFAFNTVVRGYAVNGLAGEGIEVYVQMRHRGVEPDNFTYPFLLKACTDINQGRGVHALVVKNREFRSEIHCLTSLISFYCSFGDLESARQLFDNMPERNVVTWTAMITGYVKQRRYGEGLALFREMQITGVELNELTLVGVLSACANLGVLGMGKWVHQYVDRNRIFLNPILAAALIDMYAKCGFIDVARQVFLQAPFKSVCTWNSIIGGLAMHGYGQEALERFEQMRVSGTIPDDVTLIGVLSSCSHSGLVYRGKEVFYSMRMEYGIEPNIKHYGCLVDLFCRAGKVDNAYEIMTSMPIEPNAVLWGTLLNACGVRGNVELAEIAMERLLVLEPFNDGNYVLMSNIYAAKGQWDDVAKMRKLMKDRKVERNPGSSLIEVDNVVHEFMVGDSKHPSAKHIYSMLENLALSLRGEGYVPEIS